jgi:hypothetical protein
MRRFPGLPWLEPIPIRRTDGAHGWACRLCIARDGLRASEIDYLADTPAEVIEHLRTEHGLPSP